MFRIPRNRLCLAALALVALFGAAGTGAAIKSIITIKPGHFGQLTGTNVYCQNGHTAASIRERAFLCTLWTAGSNKRRSPGSYGMLVDAGGVTPYRIDRNGNYVPVAHYYNP